MQLKTSSARMIDGLLFWVIFISTGVIGGITDISGIPSDILLMPSYMFIFFTVGVYWRRIWALIARAPITLALPAAAALSVLWSVEPGTSAGETARLLVHILTALCLLAWASTPKLFRLMAIAIALGCATSLAMYTVDRSQVLDEFGDFRGLYQQKNIFGFSAAIQLLICFNMFVSGMRRLQSAALCLLSVVIITMCNSATSLVAATAGCAFILLYRSLTLKSKDGVTAQKFAVLLLTVSGVGLAAWYYSESLILTLGRDPTLTGREKLWEAGWMLMSAEPWFGYGYQALANPDSDLARYIIRTIGPYALQFHNSWINIGVQLGIFGLALHVVYFAVLTISIYREGLNRGSSFAALMGGLFVALVIQSFTESTFGGPRSLATLIITLLIVHLPARRIQIVGRALSGRNSVAARNRATPTGESAT